VTPTPRAGGRHPAAAYCREGGAMKPQLDFMCLWDSINAKRGYGWDVNPWVWVIEFERCEKPKDIHDQPEAGR
jgi:hypothetical protein